MANNLEQVLAGERRYRRQAAQHQIGAYVYPVVAPEFSNWRSEQWAWQHGAVLFDQSHHMFDLYIKGPDALKLLSDTMINSSKGWESTRPSNMCRPRPMAMSSATASSSGWPKKNSSMSAARLLPTGCMFQAEKGGYNVEIINDPRSPARPMGKPVNRISWRFQIQGPRPGT